MARTRRLVEPAVQAAVDRLPPLVRRVVGYHLGWWSADGNALPSSGGKMIRPALVLASARAVGGRPKDAVPAAVAVELTHQLSLLHDDVMDADRVRRGRPAAWTVFGVSRAILAGDALLVLAGAVLRGTPADVAAAAADRLDAALLELCEGQSLDCSFAEHDDVGLAECEAMAEAKTGALMGCACALGAMCGGGDADQVAALDDFGRALGVVFQLVDDALSIWGDPALTGKPAHSDLANRKRSLPVVAALNAAAPASRQLAALYERGGTLGSADLAGAVHMVEAAVGRDWARRRAAARLAAALDRLGQIAAKPEAADLLELADGICHRDR